MWARFLLFFLLNLSGLASTVAAQPKIQWHWPKEGPSVSVLLLVTSEKGVNSFFTREVERWVEAGYGVMAVDLFKGQTPKDEKEANRFRDALNTESTAQILSEALHNVLGQARTDKARIGLLSWGVGASHSLRWLRDQTAVRGAVLVSANPLLERKELTKIRAKIFFAYPKNSAVFSGTELKNFESALREAKLDYQLQTYPAGAPLFMDFSSAKTFEPAASEKLRVDVTSYLGRHVALKEYK
jgi:dienelactone hydrolase